MHQVHRKLSDQQKGKSERPECGLEKMAASRRKTLVVCRMSSAKSTMDAMTAKVSLR